MQARHDNTFTVDREKLNPLDFLHPKDLKIWNALSGINENERSHLSILRYIYLNEKIEKIKKFMGRCHIEYLDYINEQLLIHIKCDDSITFEADVLISKQDISSVLEILTNQDAQSLTRIPVLTIKNLNYPNLYPDILINHSNITSKVLYWMDFLCLVGASKNIVLDPEIAIQINELVIECENLKKEQQTLKIVTDMNGPDDDRCVDSLYTYKNSLKINHEEFKSGIDDLQYTAPRHISEISIDTAKNRIIVTCETHYVRRAKSEIQESHYEITDLKTIKLATEVLCGKKSLAEGTDEFIEANNSGENVSNTLDKCKFFWIRYCVPFARTKRALIDEKLQGKLEMFINAIEAVESLSKKQPSDRNLQDTIVIAILQNSCFFSPKIKRNELPTKICDKYPSLKLLF